MRLVEVLIRRPRRNLLRLQAGQTEFGERETCAQVIYPRPLSKHVQPFYIYTLYA